MTKKVVLALLFAALIGGGVFAQSNAPNTITFGSMLAYERTLTPKFAIGVDASVDFFGIPTVTLDGEVDTVNGWVAVLPLAIDAFARLYPWEGKFFAQLGLGFQANTMTNKWAFDTATYTAAGFHAKLQAGWKIDIGQPAKWIFEARLGPGMGIGGMSKDGEVMEKVSYVMITFPVQVGLGYSF